MPEYGAYKSLSDGALSILECFEICKSEALAEAKKVADKLGIELPRVEFITRSHTPTYKPSRKSLEESGLTADEIEDELAWAETVEWPQYQDSFGWKFRVSEEELA